MTIIIIIIVAINVNPNLISQAASAANKEPVTSHRNVTHDCIMKTQ
jgi:hypothetical protein